MGKSKIKRSAIYTTMSAMSTEKTSASKNNATYDDY